MFSGITMVYISTNLALLGGHMRGVGARVREALATVLTNKWLFTTVDPLVFLETNSQC